MAYTTAHQSDTLSEVILSFGEPNRVRFEETGEPYGLLWLQWTSNHWNQERNVIVRPDGSQVLWRDISGVPETVPTLGEQHSRICKVQGPHTRDQCVPPDDAVAG